MIHTEHGPIGGDEININFIENRIKEIEEAIKSLGSQKNELIQQYNNTRSALNNLVQQGNKNVR